MGVGAVGILFETVRGVLVHYDMHIYAIVSMQIICAKKYRLQLFPTIICIYTDVDNMLFSTRATGKLNNI